MISRSLTMHIRIRYGFTLDLARSSSNAVIVYDDGHIWMPNLAVTRDVPISSSVLARRCMAEGLNPIGSEISEMISLIIGD